MKKLWYDRESLVLLICSAAFSASILLLFGPLQMYLSNISELWFSLGTVFVPSIICFILVTAVLIGIGFLLFNVKKVFYGYTTLLCGLGLALYIQGNFIPFNYGILNGATIDWTAYAAEAKLSVAVWAICVILPFVLWLIIPKKCKAILKWASCGIFMVQFIALVGLSVTTDFSQSAVSEFYISDKGLYEVSDEQNVFIFVLDAFDGAFLKEVYEAEPDFLDFMDGFTYFTDAASAYPNTRGSLPYILTGQYYENDKPYNEYISDAWMKNADYYQKLQEKGFEIGIYTSLSTAISDEAKASFVSNAVQEKVGVASYFEFEKEMLRFTAMRFFPDFAKKYIWIYDSQFEKFKVSSDKTISPFTWEETNFYQHIIDEKLSVTKGKKYHFIHLDGTHIPYTVLEDLSMDESTATAITEAKGSLNVIREFVRQLKELGVYDKSCIIVTADHGTSTTNPIMIAKRFGDSGDFQLNSRLATHSNLQGTLMKELGEGGYGRSLFDSKNDLKENYRCFSYFMNGEQELNGPYFPDMVEYYQIVDDENILFYSETGRVYTSSGIKELTPVRVEVGKPIAYKYSDGISAMSGFMFSASGRPAIVDYLWVRGYRAHADFPVDECENDLMCHIRLETVLAGIQHIVIKSHGITLYDGVISSDMPYINFSYPKQCVENSVISLDLECPDACSPYQLGISADQSIISVGIREILFEEQRKTGEIIFNAAGNANDYFYDGWHAAEPDACWTAEIGTLLTILLSDQDQQMQVSYLTNPAAKDTKVYYNGEYIATLPHHDGFSKETITLPAEYKSDTDAQKITFITDGATTYKGTGGDDGTDQRILGIYVSEIDFTDAVQP